MIALPPIHELIKRTKALATLDLIFSPEWDYRYYSFNSNWSSTEQMASMRNGSGDEWWMVFHNNGWAALKGLGHEYAWSKGRTNISVALSDAFPPELSEFAKEPAFRWDETNFAYFCISDRQGWKRANDLLATPDIHETGEEDLLRHVVGAAEDYASFVESYFEKTAPVEIISSIFELQPITSSTVTTLNPKISLEDISSELYGEIAYPGPL